MIIYRRMITLQLSRSKFSHKTFVADFAIDVRLNRKTAQFEFLNRSILFGISPIDRAIHTLLNVKYLLIVLYLSVSNFVIFLLK